jgi:hypothetical protein|tara:strand:- start:138 stop:305 length:168 start_codon:yes stop_codon:yes gene_type:complete
MVSSSTRANSFYLGVVFGEVVLGDVGGCFPVKGAVCSVMIVEVDEAVVAEGSLVL